MLDVKKGTKLSPFVIFEKYYNYSIMAAKSTEVIPDFSLILGLTNWCGGKTSQFTSRSNKKSKMNMAANWC